MPDYLVFETTGARKLTDSAPRRVNNAASEAEAVAVVLIDQGFKDDQTFTVFRVGQGVKVPVQQSRTVVQLDPADPTGTTVLKTYTEAQLEALSAARGK
jgi:hypothetical protein